MGVRLAINLIKNGKFIGSGYKHSSGYTFLALRETKRLLDYYLYCYSQTSKQLDDDTDFAIELLHVIGCGLSEEDCKKYNSNYLMVDRDRGITSVSPFEISISSLVANMRVDIDLTKFKCDLSDLFFPHTVEEYEGYHEEKIDLNDLPELRYDLKNATFADFYHFYKEYENKLYRQGELVLVPMV